MPLIMRKKNPTTTPKNQNTTPQPQTFTTIKENLGKNCISGTLKQQQYIPSYVDHLLLALKIVLDICKNVRLSKSV